MKKLLLLLLSISLFGFNSCEKNIPEAPGKIPGLGFTPGEIEIKKPFVLPEGINVVGDITGIGNPVAKNELKPLLAYDSKSIVPKYGSGCVVRLRVPLLNTRNSPRTVFFPQGLIFKCIDRAYQHGLVCQIFWVTLEPNERRDVIFDVYCGNLDIPSPDEDGKYQIWGVTSSTVLWDLLKTIGWKKINYEMIFKLMEMGKGIQEGPSYDEITQKIQTMVWNLTNNGIPISTEDRAFLNTIPEMELAERPIVDSNSQFPEYFEEFLVTEK